MSFANLKKTRNDFFKKASEEAAKQNTKASREEDNRFWQPEVDKAGNGYAVIRFLPAPDGEDLPWVRVFSHAFKNSAGAWFIENCPTTLGENCPVCENNSELWNTGSKENQDVVRGRKRKLNYISNILVVKDSNHPENEGKVFLYKYGKKIFDKLNALMHPEFEDETPVNPFDMWEGANFKLKIRQVEGYRNYDKSEFDKPSAISSDDDDMKKIYESEFSLTEFIDPKEFKAYAQLEDRLMKVLSNKSTSTRKQEEDDEESRPAPTSKVKPAPAPKTKVKDEDDDDTLDYLKGLASDLDDEIPF